jgi:hypothetical protein
MNLYKFFKTNNNMTTENVITSIFDPKIQDKNFNNKEFWLHSYHPEDFSDETRKTYKKWYKYTIKFENTKPIQLMKYKEI